MSKTKFQPEKHLTLIKGQKYLEVKYRLVWFRQDHPDWTIETEPLEINTEKQYVIFRAKVLDKGGRLIANGTKTETKNGFFDYLEKAETGAVGRALALCGYGTQFAPELEEAERIVDSPIEANGHAKRNSTNGVANGQAQYGKRVDTPEQAHEAVAPHCQVHGVPMKYRQGKRGPFWSCAERLPDGNWCNQTQQVARPVNGQASSPSLHA